MSHIWIKPYLNESYDAHVRHTNEKCHQYERVMSHLRTSHVMRYMNESCRAYEWVIPHIWTRHVTQMNESYYTHEVVMSHTWTSRVARRNASCLRKCHVSHMNETHLTHERCMSHTWMSHVTRGDGSCHTHKVSRPHLIIFLLYAYTYTPFPPKKNTQPPGKRLARTWLIQQAP